LVTDRRRNKRRQGHSIHPRLGRAPRAHRLGWTPQGDAVPTACPRPGVALAHLHTFCVTKHRL